VFVAKKLPLVAACALLLAACSKEVPKTEDIRPVRTMTLQASDIDVNAEFSGEVRARVESRLGFRVGGKIFATLQPGLKKGMVSLSPEEQARFLEEAPKMFEPAAGAWGRGGSTLVTLASADPEVVGEALTLAWKRRIALTKAASKKKR
jgi:hypothetical protein